MQDFDAIYAMIRQVPRGRVTSYGDIGARVGVTPRTVGWALAVAPKDVPWQRIVGHDGYLPIGKRSPHLRQMQMSLLTEEGVVVDEKGFIARKYFWGEEDEGGDPDTGQT